MEVVRQYDLLLDAHEVICFVLDYVEANQYLLTNAYSAIGQSGLKHFLYLDFVSCLERLVEQGARKEGVALDADYKQFLCAFYAEAVAGTLLDYMTHPPGAQQGKNRFLYGADAAQHPSCGGSEWGRGERRTASVRSDRGRFRRHSVRRGTECRRMPAAGQKERDQQRRRHEQKATPEEKCRYPAASFETRRKAQRLQIPQEKERQCCRRKALPDRAETAPARSLRSPAEIMYSLPAAFPKQEHALIM